MDKEYKKLPENDSTRKNTELIDNNVVQIPENSNLNDINEISGSYINPVSYPQNSNLNKLDNKYYSDSIELIKNSNNNKVIGEKLVEMSSDNNTNDMNGIYDSPIPMSSNQNLGSQVGEQFRTLPENSNDRNIVGSVIRGIPTDSNIGESVGKIIRELPDDLNDRSVVGKTVRDLPDNSSLGRLNGVYDRPIDIISNSNKLELGGDYNNPISRPSDSGDEFEIGDYGYKNPVGIPEDSDFSLHGNYTSPIDMIIDRNTGKPIGKVVKDLPIGRSIELEKEKYTNPVIMDSNSNNETIKGDYNNPISRPSNSSNSSMNGNYSTPVHMSNGNTGKSPTIKTVGLTVDKKSPSSYISVMPDGGTLLPHQNNNMVSMVPSGDESVTQMSPEMREKYENTAKWMGLQDSIDRGINSAMNFVNLLGAYDQLGSFGQKASSYVTGIMAAKEFTDNTKVPPHVLANLSAMGLLRSTVQNKSVGAWGMAKEELINKLLLEGKDALILAEKAMQTDSGRLPGAGGLANTISKGVNDIVSSIKNVFKDGSLLRTSHPDPINRPINKGSKISPTKPENLYEPESYNEGKINFNSRLSNKGMDITLEELANSSSDGISSLTDLRKLINGDSGVAGGSIITSFKNNLQNSDLNKIGLDSNHVWEITFEPLADSGLNGGFTFLPSIRSINKMNENELGIKTGYSRWLPFTSFELQSRKTTQKSLSLFDGDISYPVSMEFTNELRLTIADDQCKSFRRYFDIVSKVAIYDSTKFYSPDINGDKETEIDETSMKVAMYKNLTFRCNIYVMKMDLATVMKFPLLVVLRDYQIEYVGDTDSGPTELALHFSIVGEDNGKLASPMMSSPLSDKFKTPDPSYYVNYTADESINDVYTPELSAPEVKGSGSIDKVLSTPFPSTSTSVIST